jgi:ELP3 family radical SAM enzyme/protein acetyltransferase
MIPHNEKMGDIEDLSLKDTGHKISVNITDYDEFNSQLDDVNESIDNVNTYEMTHSELNSASLSPINILGLSHLRLENSDMVTNEDNYGQYQIYICKIVQFLIDNTINSELSKNEMKKFQKFNNKLLGDLKFQKKPRNVRVNYISRKMIQDNVLPVNHYNTLLNVTLGKKSRTQSGIMQVTVVTSPGDFSCAFDCHFCPKQEGMPRSYPKEGPSMRRAAAWNFDTVKQIQGRISSYDLMGHTVYGCKSELIVLGGTWSSYSLEYRRQFITECYYAYNTYYDDKSKPSRPMLSLAKEKDLNTKAICRIIGLTIETRPDCINQEEIDTFMEFGITRVQIGIQHTNNRILKKINRQCTIEQCMEGIQLLKDNGFKVLIHLMPNLPGSSPKLDKEMFHEILNNPMLSFDEVKIYPTVVPTTSDKDSNKVDTVIEKWFLDGKYVPYSNEELIEMLIEVKSKFPKDKRISRLFRDIPQPNTISGGEMPHMRDVIKKEMHKRNLYCRCIRCREIKDNSFNLSDIKLEIMEFEASKGKEYFISFVVPNPEIKGETLILGFCRLRLPYNGKKAFIRELHVYSQMLSHQLNHNDNDNNNNIDKNTKTIVGSQHRGLGKKLVNHAETIVKESNFDTLLIISGVGVRDYYRKLGYELNKDFYMEKKLSNHNNQFRNILIDTFLLSILLVFSYYLFIKYVFINILIYMFN